MYRENGIGHAKNILVMPLSKLFYAFLLVYAEIMFNMLCDVVF